MKTFIRSFRKNKYLECSWYDDNKKRYRHEMSDDNFFDLGIVESDNQYGYMYYAKEYKNNIIDNWAGKHPEYLE